MMMTSLYVAVQVRIHQILSSAGRDERGQGTLEYVGMIAVAAILVLAVLQAVTAIDIGTYFTTKVKSVLK